MKNHHILIILGAALVLLAATVRTGALARKNPGAPMNAAARASQTAAPAGVFTQP